MNKTAGRNHMIDAMKGIASIGVILVHFPFPGIFGRICSSVGVAGVILFFLISGYQSYCEDASQSGKILRRFRRNLALTVMAVAVHVLFTVMEQALAGTLGQWASKWLLNPMTYLRLVVLGDLSFVYGDHLWFMVAMLYGYLVLYWMEKRRLHSVFYKLLPFLLLLRIAMETYTNSFSHFSWLDWHFSGNALVGALPIMLLGSYIRSREERFLRLRRQVYVFCALIFMVPVFASVNLRVLGLDISQPFKIAAAVWIFLMCLKIPLSRPVPVLGDLGNRYNLHVYVWHFLVGVLIRDILVMLGAAQWIMDWCLPVLAVSVSVLLARVLAELAAKNRKKPQPVR